MKEKNSLISDNSKRNIPLQLQSERRLPDLLLLPWTTKVKDKCYAPKALGAAGVKTWGY
jgi:hypothetical protein